MNTFLTLNLIIIILDVASTLLVNSTKTLKNIPEDGLLNFTQLANKYGHSCEEYDVTTKDGYILKLYHIPGDRSRPVLLAHGIWGTADDLIIRGNTSLVILVAEQGYDVWALNVRGSRYSRRHVTLNPDKDKAFWDYSVHELGYYDLAANIDFVLNATAQTKLSIVGFSEGTTIVLVLASTKPEYNDKIKVFVALAPICYLQNTKGSLTSLIQNGVSLNQLAKLLSLEEVAGYYSVTKAGINVLCADLPNSYEICYKGIMLPIVGEHSEFIDREFFKIIVGHFMAGTSRKNLAHYAQIGKRKVFGQYDYGLLKNFEVYNSYYPPAYPLEKIMVKTVLVSGKNDYVSTMADTVLLKQNLANVIRHIVLEPELFNHLDHTWGYNAYQVSYPYVISTLADYN